MHVFKGVDTLIRQLADVAQVEHPLLGEGRELNLFSLGLFSVASLLQKCRRLIGAMTPLLLCPAARLAGHGFAALAQPWPLGVPDDPQLEGQSFG